MRIYNDRYSRDMRSFSLALRMLSHEGRTRTVSVWTGLSAQRVAKLSLLQRREGLHKGARRLRGPSPTHLAALLTTPSLRSEAAAIAGVCRTLRVIPAEPLSNAGEKLPSVRKGEELCSTLELFQDMVPNARWTLEHWILLVRNLAEGAEWGTALCSTCSELVVVDRLKSAPPRCEHCQHNGRGRRVRPAKPRESKLQEDAPAMEHEEESEAVQLELFDPNNMKGSGRKHAQNEVVGCQQRDAADRRGQHAEKGHVQLRRSSELPEERHQRENKRKACEHEPNDRLQYDH
jgi:hypothetical protein